MADVQEDDLPQASALNSADFLRIVADLAGTPVSKVLSRANLKTYLDTLYEPIGGGGTGWQTVTETWTRTGNHTFTVATDLTTKYQKWTKVRYKDGGAYEYGVVGSATYSAPNTTVTLVTNTDYAMAAATITDTAISYQESPQGFPTAFNFTPSFTNFTLTSATITAKWSVRNGIVTGFVNVVFGASTAITGSSVVLTLPITAFAYGASTPIGQSRFKDATGGNATIGVVLNGGNVLVFNASGTYTISDILSATVPFTWATSDDLDIQFTYLAA